MSNLVELTSVQTKSKRIDRISGKQPRKSRFAEYTALSLFNNVTNNLIEKAISLYNERYNEVYNAVVTVEREKAEEIERSKALVDESKVNALEAQIEFDEKVAKIASSDNVLRLIRTYVIELKKLKGHIGTYNGKYAINVKKGFGAKPPKALSVPKLCTDACKSVISKIDVYKMAEKQGIAGVNKDGTPKVIEKEIPNWKKLPFENVSTENQNVTVALEKVKDEPEEEFVIIPNNKVTEEDLSYRKMIGQIGDGLQSVEEYKKSKHGIPSQFEDGFNARQDSLYKMLEELVEGIKINRTISSNDKVNVDNTEFQNIVDEVTGYKEPMSEEEHKKMEASLNEYYSNEDVSSKINELKEKDMLYIYNQNMDDVIKSEITQNKKEAENKVVKSVEETNTIEQKNIEQDYFNYLQEQADIQAHMLKMLYDYIDARDKFEEEKRIEEENKRIEDEKLRQAREEQRRKDEQASREYQSKIEKMIYSSAQEEALNLFNRNMAIDAGRKEGESLFFKIAGDTQAKELIDKAKNEEQANEIKMIREVGAPEQAREIIDKAVKEEQQQKEAEKIEEQANELKMIREEGAPEQARELINEAIKEEQQQKDAKKSEEQEIELKKIHIGARNQAQDLIIEAKLAKQQEKDMRMIDEWSPKQAELIEHKSRRDELLNESKILEEKLKSIKSETEKINDRIEDIANDDDEDEIKPENIIIEAPVAEEKQEMVLNQNIISDEEMKSSALEEATKINDSIILAKAGDEQANELFIKDLIHTGAEEDALKIHEANMLAKAGEEAAQLIFLKNMGADQAQKIFDNEMKMIQKAEMNRKAIISDSVVSEPVVEPVAIVEPVQEPVAVVEPTPVNNDSNLVVLNNVDRYAELKSKSKALSVKENRINTIRKRNSNSELDQESAKKQMLTSLKEELEREDYDFLRISDNSVVPNVKSA